MHHTSQMPQFGRPHQASQRHSESWKVALEVDDRRLLVR